MKTRSEIKQEIDDCLRMIASNTDAIATDVDDTVDVAASTAGLSLLQFNKCIRAL
jgi:hypothetical protein